MLIIYRWWYFLGLAGVGFTGFGLFEMSDAWANGSEPAPISLASLEAGTKPPQTYVSIGEHVALFPFLSSRQKAGVVEATCYPIVSRDHEYLRAWGKLGERYGTASVPAEEVPELMNARVYVLDKRPQQSIANLQKDRRERESIEGIFVAGVGAEDHALLAASGTEGDRRVLVLDAGRRPRPLSTCVQYLVLGVVLLGAAVGRLVRTPGPSLG
jgi:hypothetical protein